jgi:hypothetical protein
MLTMMVTPTQADYAKGLFRAQKQGKTRLPWWDDLSFNWVGLALIAGIVLAAGTIAGTVAAGAPNAFAASRQGSFPLALAATVLTVAYFGLAFQYFLLRFAKRGAMYFALFIFIVWLLPIVAGSIQSLASGPMRSNDNVGAPLFALSPAPGIGMVAAIGDDQLATAVQAATITPALLFTFVFNYLLIGARRRVMRTVFLATAKKQEEAEELMFDEPVAGGTPG